MKRYPKEFKEGAVKLAKEKGFTRTGKDLGVAPSTIMRWSKGSLSVTLDDGTIENVDTLKKQVQQLKKEKEELLVVNDILKKSAAIFSQDHWRSIR